MIYKRLVMFLFVSAAALSVSGCSSMLSFLDEDENGKTVEQRVLADSLSNIGVTQRTKAKIDYTPRKGITVPKSLAGLPEPQGPDLSVKAVNANKKYDTAVSPHVQAQGQGALPAAEIAAGTEKGAGLVKAATSSRNTIQQNPSDLTAEEWRAGEEKEKQGLLAKGPPVESYNTPSALDWTLGRSQAAKPEFSIEELKNADTSRKTIYDPPSKYRAPAPMDNLKPDEIHQIERAGRPGWLPW